MTTTQHKTQQTYTYVVKIVKMLTLQEYIGKVNKILIFCFPFFVLFCIFFVSHMPVPTELKNPLPKMEKPPIYEVEQIEVRGRP